MLGGRAAEGEHDLAPGVEVEIVDAGDGQQEHHEDEPVVDNHVL